MALTLLTSGAILMLMTPRHKRMLPSWRLRGEAFGFGLANGACNVLTGLAIGYAGVGNAAFAFATLPLWMVLIARPLVGDRVPLRATPALALGGVGIALLLLSGRGSDGGDQVVLGLVLGIASAIIGSASALAGRRLVPSCGIEAVAAWTMFSGGLVLLPLVDWRALLALSPLVALVLLVWIGAHYILAPLLYNRSSVVAPAFVIAVATFVNPSLAPVWGAIFYSERVAPLAILGLALALGANILLLLIIRSTRAQPEADSVLDADLQPALEGAVV
jgi:drug/metabolite transporter (DMT)-like permease